MAEDLDEAALVAFDAFAACLDTLHQLKTRLDVDPLALDLAATKRHLDACKAPLDTFKRTVAELEAGADDAWRAHWPWPPTDRALIYYPVAPLMWEELSASYRWTAWKDDRDAFETSVGIRRPVYADPTPGKGAREVYREYDAVYQNVAWRVEVLRDAAKMNV